MSGRDGELLRKGKRQVRNLEIASLGISRTYLFSRSSRPPTSPEPPSFWPRHAESGPYIYSGRCTPSPTAPASPFGDINRRAKDCEGQVMHLIRRHARASETSPSLLVEVPLEEFERKKRKLGSWAIEDE